MKRLLDRAIQAGCGCGDPDCSGGEEDPCALLGTIMGLLASGQAPGQKRDKLTIFAPPELESIGDWIEQLIAESTGKEGRGIVPVIGEPLGEARVYGEDRLFVQLRLQGSAAAEADLKALERAGHPVVRIELRDLYDLGYQFFLWEMATAVAGHLLNINPFDQPNVESAKVRAREMMSAYTERGSLPDDSAEPPQVQVLETFLSQAGPGDYVGVQAYVEPSAPVTDLLQQLRTRIRDRYRVATTLGYGPRFLHSTGQLHKGDGGAGLFVQLTSEPGGDAPIPDTAGQESSGVSFGTLKMAQALGDKQALKDNRRRVIRIHLGTEVEADLKALLSGLGK